MKTINEWGQEKGAEAWEVEGVKQLRVKDGWRGEGKQVSEAEFDAARAEVRGLKLYAYEQPKAPAATVEERKSNVVTLEPMPMESEESPKKKK